MDIDKVVKELNSKFSAPLPEYYQRRIIIWHDEIGEFSDKLDEINLANAKLVKLTGTNNFAIKKLINHDDITSNILLYNSFPTQNFEDNWLLDIELYSESFHADLLSIWLEDLQIGENLREIVKYYRKYFNAKPRRDKFKKLAENGVSEVKNLHLTIMAALANAKSTKPNSIIRQILMAGLDESENRIYQDFVAYGADKIFYQMVKKLGYNEEKLNLYKLAEFIVQAALAQVLPGDYLQINISSINQARCYALIAEWLHSGDKIAINTLQDIIDLIVHNLNLAQKLNYLAVSDLAEIEILPCIDNLILLKFMEDIDNDIVDTDLILQTVEKRKNYLWYEAVKHYYCGLIELAHMQIFYKTHIDDFHLSEASELWTKYTNEFYLMDTYYRKFHYYCAQISKNYCEEFYDAWNKVISKVENLYANWFLDKLGDNWSNICADNLATYGRVNLNIPKQTDFYADNIANADSRVFVIISDAMRYEVAAELAAKLKQTQGDVCLESMEGIFPTITKFGMAALLPHEQLSLQIKNRGDNKYLAVLADDQSTEANNRDKILKLANPASIALKYSDMYRREKS